MNDDVWHLLGNGAAGPGEQGHGRGDRRVGRCESQKMGPCRFVGRALYFLQVIEILLFIFS